MANIAGWALAILTHAHTWTPSSQITLLTADSRNMADDDEEFQLIYDENDDVDGADEGPGAQDEEPGK